MHLCCFTSPSIQKKKEKKGGSCCSNGTIAPVQLRSAVLLLRCTDTRNGSDRVCPCVL
uniref:Uncharacterized protein n=1 Tax=Anguilla anguilla TaxID=7936 RepID=A0A0E9XW73_ANGAN